MKKILQKRRKENVLRSWRQYWQPHGCTVNVAVIPFSHLLNMARQLGFAKVNFPSDHDLNHLSLFFPHKNARFSDA